ncbi:MAG: hypothetical protein U0K86_02215 [Agathobacter sp.]|nr:hypothetical protein [Agathobacter sp.]
MEYDDGARTLFLYTHGEKTEGVSEAIQQLLKFMEQTQRENAVNEDLEIIQNMVEEIKNDQEVSIEYMKVHEHEEMLQRIAHEEGYREGECEGANTLAQTIVKIREGKTNEELLNEGISMEIISLAMSLK